MEELVERRLDRCAANSLAAVDQALLDERDGTRERGGGRALRAARLQEVEPVVLDRELDVLHVAVVRSSSATACSSSLVRVRKRSQHACDRLRCARSRDDVLALGVDEELAVQPGLHRSRGSG